MTREEAIARIRNHKIAHKMNEPRAIYISEALDMAIKALEQEPRWIPVSERLPNEHECMKNNGLFNVSDGNRSYFGWFDIYDTKRFVKPTIAGFRVDNAVIAWMPLPEPYKEESEEVK